MDYLPVSLRLRDEPVLLVGGGTVATRKARLLIRSGARITVVAPLIDDGLRKMIATADGICRTMCYTASCLDGQRLVVAATPDRALNAQICRDARALSIPVNVVDDPDLCSFIFPAIVDRNPLLVAVSSSGSSPVLTRILRRKLEALLPAAYGRLASFAGELREEVKAALPNPDARRSFWEQVLDGSVAEQVLSGREEQARQRLRRALRNSETVPTGEVYLLGAGPGDPDLLTFKAARLLQRADVVLYDRLVAPVIVDMARRDAQRIYVGKRRAEHAVSQPEINQMLLDLASAGKRVARLKGGDPFIFGRGGEEIDLLAKNGIPFQVVPGISAANGAASYAGIPLTHRDHAHSVRFVAGYLKEGRVEHDWEQYLSPDETLVFYMALVSLPVICAQLQAHGRAPETPVALVQQATTERQRVLRGTLADMADIVAREQPRAPTLLIIGDVVQLHETLNWFGEPSAD